MPPPDLSAPLRRPARDLGAGDLAEAYRQHSAAVFGLASRLLRDRMLAEEVTQEVFVRLWRDPDRFDPAKGSMRSYLMAICHGRAVDAIRSESARRRREERDSLAGVARSPDLAQDICDATIRDQAAHLVEELPDAEREAISLAFHGGLTYLEVATVLGAPLGTVKGRIRKGLRRTRAQMFELGIDAP